MQIEKPRSIVYIDGYNWYHAIFKHYPEWKWANVQSLFESLRPDENVISVKMFSAMIDPHNLGSDARERQKRYFDALRTLPKVKVILGAFQNREVQCKANGCRYSFHEEKKTDVNIAVEMLSDAFSANCDSMCIVSGDSDIQPAVEWVAGNKSQIKITVYVPSLPNDQPSRRTDYYKTKGLAVDCKFLPTGNIKDHQLPNVVKLGNGKMSVRPHLWARLSN
jgi:hypothetical protein